MVFSKERDKTIAAAKEAGWSVKVYPTQPPATTSYSGMTPEWPEPSRRRNRDPDDEGNSWFGTYQEEGVEDQLDGI
jgi:hypothetical protein